MEAAQFANRFVPGPQVKMVSIGENYRNAQLLPKVALGQAFDCSLGSDRHENGRGDIAVFCVEDTGASPCLRALRQQFECDLTGVRHDRKPEKPIPAARRRGLKGDVVVGDSLPVIFLRCCWLTRTLSTAGHGNGGLL